METSNLNSFQQEALYQELISSAQQEAQFKLFQMLKPRIFLDGDKWCVLYGENIQEGIVGFGDNPASAISEWNQQWYENLKK